MGYLYIIGGIIGVWVAFDVIVKIRWRIGYRISTQHIEEYLDMHIRGGYHKCWLRFKNPDTGQYVEFYKWAPCLTWLNWTERSKYLLILREGESCSTAEFSCVEDMVSGRGIDYEVEEKDGGRELRADIGPDLELATELAKGICHDCLDMPEAWFRACIAGGLRYWPEPPPFIQGWTGPLAQKAQKERTRRRFMAGAPPLLMAACGNHNMLQNAIAGPRADLDREDINTPNSHGTTSLIAAAYYGQDKATEILLENGADPDLWDKDRRTALHYAAMNGYPDVARLLLDADARTDLPDIEERGYRTPLHHAAAEGHAEVVKELLEADAPAQARDADGKTPLDLARENHHPDIVRLLGGDERAVEAASVEHVEGSSAKPESDDREPAELDPEALDGEQEKSGSVRSTLWALGLVFGISLLSEIFSDDPTLFGVAMVFAICGGIGSIILVYAYITGRGWG